MVRMSDFRLMTLLQLPRPLPDPSNVYKEGTVLTLHEQQLPSEHLSSQSELRLDDPSLDLERNTPNGRLINCGRHNVQPCAASPALQVELLDPLSTGLRDKLPQVWKVKSGDETYIARIFDPLYVDEEGAADIFLMTANNMNDEASAYTRLADLQGILIPRFKGCFLTVVDTVSADLEEHSIRTAEIPNQRSVYVLLLGYVPGTDLLRHQPSVEWPVCEAHRTAVMRAVCVAWHELRLRDISHCDFAGRNIILKDAPVSEDSFCQDPVCRLRFQMPTTLVRACKTGEMFPIAVIDFEEYETEEGYTRPLVTDWNEVKKSFPQVPPSWKE